ncbi:MAG: hypothetical protein GYA14_13910, partial [Ignavibacteria bacterium]|nr:hypothetical protein [Ignavibacteria bacterium]
NLFLAPGLIFHYTVAIQTGGHSGSASRDGWFAFPSLTVGVAILKSLSILITYNYAQINNYYNSFSPTLLKREQRNLDLVIRLALEFGKQN